MPSSFGDKTHFVEADHLSRRKGLRTGRFLILGSASIDLLRQSGESLAAGIEYVDLCRLDITKVATADNGIHHLTTDSPNAPPAVKKDKPRSQFTQKRVATSP